MSSLYSEEFSRFTTEKMYELALNGLSNQYCLIG